MIKINHLIASFFMLTPFFSYSQRENTYTLEASAILGTKQTPFWMRANKYGKVPTKGQTAAVFFGINSDYQNSESKIDWGYGLNIGGFAGMENKFMVQQAFVKAKWRAFELYAGRREEIQGLVDTTLTSGSYIWSGNALPMPKVQLAIPEYTSIGGEGLIAIKGNYAHGWFENTRTDANNIYLHQKSFYFRVGKQNYKLKFYGGFNHQAQWGGISKFESFGAVDTIRVGTKFGSSFKDYLNVITGKSQVNETGATSIANEKGNRLGNHLGTIDLALELRFKPFDLFLYRQNIYEDGSLFYLNNITDGLNGICVKFKNQTNKNIQLNKIIFEFLNTLSQGGSFFDDPRLPNIRGNDNYMNNGVFRDGWSYRGTGIGTPFILGKGENIIKIRENDFLFFNNNKVQAYYLGMSGSFLRIYYFTSKISFSKNWGTNSYPENLFQTSINFNLCRELDTKIGRINTFVNLATDLGALFQNNFAVQFGVKKSWSGLKLSDILKINGHTTHQH